MLTHLPTAEFIDEEELFQRMRLLLQTTLATNPKRE